MAKPKVKLPTAEVAQYARQRSNAKANNQFDINALNLRQSRLETDFGRTFSGENIGGGIFDRTKDAFRYQRASLPSQFVGRGIMDSGIFKDAINRHFKEKNTALSDLELQFARAGQDFELTREGLGTALEQALAEIEGNQQLRESVYAEMLRDA